MPRWKNLKATESEFTRAAIALWQACGWKVAHHPDSRRLRGDKGLQDLICARAGDVLLVELKRDGERRRPAQLEWHEAAGRHSYCFEESQWDEMQALAQRGPTQRT